MNADIFGCLRLHLLALAGLGLNSCAVVRVLDQYALNPVKYSDSDARSKLDQPTRDRHRTLLVADLHADTLMLDRGGVRGIQASHHYGHADVPRWREGNVGFQVLTVATVTPVPYMPAINGGLLPNAQWVISPLQGWPVSTWFNSHAHALHQAWKWQMNTSGEGSGLTAIRTQGDLQRFLDAHYRQVGDNWQPLQPQQQPVATVLGLEGSHALHLHESDSDAQIASRVREFREAGFRMLALTHRFDNALAGASEGSCRGGVTKLGHRLLNEMERQGLICDLAHASSATIDEALDQHPHLSVMMSHGGIDFGEVTGKQHKLRLVELAQARRIAQRGGVLGIGLWPEVIGEAEPALAAAMIKRCIDDPLIGAQHVALGSDMDGSAHMAFAANNWALLSKELAKLPDAQLRAVMGGNVMRFFLQHLPVK